MSRLPDTLEITTAPWIYRFLRRLFTLMFQYLCRWRIEGLENVPAEGPVIIASNHVSNWDPIIIGCALHRKIHFMAKAELFSMPVVGWFVKALGAYPVERGKSGRQAIKASLEILAQNELIGLFPEGTRSKTGEVGEAKAGTVMIAAKGKATIIPVGLHNSQHVFSKGWFRPFAIYFGQPIKIELPEGEKLTSKRLESLSDDLMAEITCLIQRPS